MKDEVWDYHSALVDLYTVTAEHIRQSDSQTFGYTSVRPSEKLRNEAREILLRAEALQPSASVLLYLRRAFLSRSNGRAPICGRYNCEHEYVAARMWDLLQEAIGERLSSQGHDDVWEERFANQIAALLGESQAAVEIAGDIEPAAATSAATIRVFRNEADIPAEYRVRGSVDGEPLTPNVVAKEYALSGSQLSLKCREHRVKFGRAFVYLYAAILPLTDKKRLANPTFPAGGKVHE